MADLDCRAFITSAAAIGATAAFAPSHRGAPSALSERRDLYLQGVASGDPKPSSVILWT